jgi:hypothetical protein
VPRQLLALTLVASLVWAPAARAQSVTSDPEILKGIGEVEDGDYDPAILTLDTAARRLAGDPGRARDLSQAYLYLGIAYIGKGHEAVAKAKFREAVAQAGDLSLSPDKFPPKVIDLFEAARAEARAESATRPPSPASSPAPPVSSAPATSASAQTRKGGGGKAILILGGIAAAGAGIALAAGGGGGSAPSASTTTTPTTLPPTPSSQSLQRMDSVSNQEQKGYVVTASKAGTLTVKVMWQNRDVLLQLDCQESNAPYTPCAGTYKRLNDTSAEYIAPVLQKEYLVLVENFSGRAGAESYTVLIEYP